LFILTERNSERKVNWSIIYCQKWKSRRKEGRVQAQVKLKGIGHITLTANESNEGKELNK